MKRKRSLLLICLIFMFAFSATMVSVVKSSPAITEIYVNPLTNTAPVGESFNISINIREVTDLYAYNFHVRWNTSVLNVTSVIEGDFLNEHGISDTYFVPKMYNEEGPKGYKGYIVIWNTLTGPRNGVDGSGTLATVTFKVVEAAGCALDLYDVLLYDSLYGSPGSVPIEQTTEDGYFSVSPPKFHVDPPSIVNQTLAANDIFTVSINISAVVDLYSFRFKLSYDTTILNSTEVVVVPFLNDPVSVDSGINRASGFVWVNVTSTAEDPISGSGTLANVTFQVVGVGECVLDLYDTKVTDKLAESVSEHNPPAEDGYFSNEPVSHDITVTKIIVFPIDLTPGEIVSIDVTVANAGGFSESFDVSVSYDGVFIEEEINVIVEVGAKTVVEFTWDTTEIPVGTYTIKAEATAVPGETNIGDNTKTFSGTVEIHAVAGPDILLYAVVGIVIIVIGALLIYFLKIRKPKST